MHEMTQERVVDVHYALLPAEIAVFEQAMHMLCSRLGIPKGETALVYDRAQHHVTQHMRVFYPVVIPDPIPAIEPESVPVESSDAVVPSVESETSPMEDMREGQP